MKTEVFKYAFEAYFFENVCLSYARERSKTSCFAICLSDSDVKF